MRLRQYESLRNFVEIARHDSLSAAADRLCLTKGALSHQIRRLEEELGFTVFERHARGIRLTTKGKELLLAARQSFEQIERKAEDLAGAGDRSLTIGVTTYFASRWLSPRLMEFMRAHPQVRLRIQPMIDLLDFRGEGVDLAIRWGDGRWTDCLVDALFLCPALPTGNRDALAELRDKGPEAAFAGFTLLQDREDSMAWSHWYDRAGLPRRLPADSLIIPDPNVRVQAVLDGQGIALNDALVGAEMAQGGLFALSEVALEDYGYFLAHQPDALAKPDAVAFAEWIKSAAAQTTEAG